MWCDFGANLVQHFIGRYTRYSRYRTKTHDKATISHDITRYQTVFLKLQEITRTAPQSAFKWHPPFLGGCHSCYPASFRGRQPPTLSFELKTLPRRVFAFLAVLTVHKEIVSTFSRYKKCSTWRTCDRAGAQL